MSRKKIHNLHNFKNVEKIRKKPTDPKKVTHERSQTKRTGHLRLFIGQQLFVLISQKNFGIIIIQNRGDHLTSNPGKPGNVMKFRRT